MQNTLVIGDIHGCYDELMALLDKAELGDGDAIIGIGDVVDRGPETPQVIKVFNKSPNIKTLMGNHERKHVRADRHEVKLAISQRISQLQLGRDYPAALAWMAALPLFIDLPDALLVHGYYEPGVPLEHQKPSILCGTMGGQKILQQHYSRPWYELYEVDKPIIVGHENYTNSDKPFVYRDRVFGLDTSCVTGKALTGIVLPSFKLISVPSRGNLWMQVHRTYQNAWSQSHPKPAPVVWDEAEKQKGQILLEKLQEVNRMILSQIAALDGFADMSPRQQAKLYSERVGREKVSDLLHLTRLGKLDLNLLQKIVQDPGRLPALIEKVIEMEREYSAL